MSTFEGRWLTRFGPMTLTQQGDRLEGSYRYRGATNSISGTLQGQRLHFSYAEAAERGEGVFELTREGHFIGEYRPEGADRTQAWNGHRPFDGLWYTSIGPVRMIETGDRVIGFVNNPAGSVLEGEITGNRLTWRFTQGPEGEGWFEVGEEFDTLAGHFKGSNGAEQGELQGARAQPNPHLAWLVVLEAHWQRSLADAEFAFGHMLGEVFARFQHINVRHRFFSDETSLLQWCRELMFLAEPAVLVITSHGEKEGIKVNGKLIDTARVIGSLRYADTLKLLHFSCCLIADGGTKAMENPGFPVSGYTNSVDWNASALSEFIYLDMILGKGLSPDEAAAQVLRLIGFAGQEAPEGSPYPPAGFTFVPRMPVEGAAPLIAAVHQPARVAEAGAAGAAGGWSALRRLVGL